MPCQGEQGTAELSSEIQYNSDINSSGDESAMLLIRSFRLAQNRNDVLFSGNDEKIISYKFLHF